MNRSNIVFAFACAAVILAPMSVRADDKTDKIVARQIAQAEKAVAKATAKLEKARGCQSDPAPCVAIEVNRLTKSGDRIAKLLAQLQD